MHTITIHCTVKRGLIPAEKTVYITSAEGVKEELTVSNKSLCKGRLEVSEIARKSKAVLVELPRETASGRWRVWVKQSLLEA